MALRCFNFLNFEEFRSSLFINIPFLILLYKGQYWICSVSNLSVVKCTCNEWVKHWNGAILRHYWKRCSKAAEAARKICEVEGEGTVEIRAPQVWFKRFRDDDVSLANNPRSGRPLSINSETVRQAVEANPCNSTCKLSAELRASQPTVVRHLQRIGKVSRSCQNVPHELTPSQQQRRVEVCQQVLKNPQDHRFLICIVIATKSGYTWRILTCRDSGWIPSRRHFRYQNRVGLKEWLCVVFGGISRESSTMSWFLKGGPSMPNSI